MRKRFSGQVLNLDNSVLIVKANKPNINILGAERIFVPCSASFVPGMFNTFLTL